MPDMLNQVDDRDPFFDPGVCLERPPIHAGEKKNVGRRLVILIDESSEIQPEMVGSAAEIHLDR